MFICLFALQEAEELEQLEAESEATFTRAAGSDVKQKSKAKAAAREERKKLREQGQQHFFKTIFAIIDEDRSGGIDRTEMLEGDVYLYARGVTRDARTWLRRTRRARRSLRYDVRAQHFHVPHGSSPRPSTRVIRCTPRSSGDAGHAR